MSAQSTNSRGRRLGYLAAAGTTAAAVAAAGVLIAVPASAASAPSGTTTSSYPNGVKASLQLQHSDPGRIEAGFEIDHAKVNSVWRVRLMHNGVTYFVGRRTATAPDGSFSVDRRLPNLGGTDTVSGTARNLATGQICRVSGRI